VRKAKQARGEVAYRGRRTALSNQLWRERLCAGVRGVA
jgi:hypothetical protein